MTAVEFARMVLQELPSEEETTSFQPSPNQMSYADSLGIEPVEWESGISSHDFSRLIDERKIFFANFQDSFRERPATGIYTLNKSSD